MAMATNAADSDADDDGIVNIRRYRSVLLRRAACLLLAQAQSYPLGFPLFLQDFGVLIFGDEWKGNEGKRETGTHGRDQRRRRKEQSLASVRRSKMR